ncbi:hypothetical protein [Kitasatospora sp. NPDC093558]|uniref:hypothetical protein n=1 Tax=Kitasatospora sp. NPDC093558 TaxID=3155201 RepID=UPI00343BD56F
MYLVHVSLHRAPGAELPEETADWVRAAARPDERVEHVVAHPRAVPAPVVGIFLLADRLEDAEALALLVYRRAMAQRPGLAGWLPLHARVPLLAPYYERLLADPGVDGI